MIDFDDEKFFLGTLCKYNHEYRDTKKSLRYTSGFNCVCCLKDNQRRKYQEKPERREYHRQYYEKNKERISLYQKEYYRSKVKEKRKQKSKEVEVN